VKVATISETKNQLSALLDFVRQGESILVLDRKKPIARIVPISDEDGSDEEARLWQLERNGLVHASRRGPAKQILKEPPPVFKTKKSLKKILDEDRGE